MQGDLWNICIKHKEITKTTKYLLDVKTFIFFQRVTHYATMALIYLYFHITTLLFGENKKKATIMITKCKKIPAKPKNNCPTKKSQTKTNKKNSQNQIPIQHTKKNLKHENKLNPPQKVAWIIPRTQNITDLGFNIALKLPLSNHLDVITWRCSLFAGHQSCSFWWRQAPWYGDYFNPFFLHFFLMAIMFKTQQKCSKLFSNRRTLLSN